MEIECMLRRSISVAVWIAALAAQIATEAWSQPAWRPDKAVEVITSSAAGGSNDQVARTMQKILQDGVHDWDGQFLRSRDAAKYLDAEYNATKAIMAELGLAK